MLKAYLVYAKSALGTFFLCFGLYSLAGMLYGLPAEPFVYSAALAGFVAGIGFVAGFFRFRSRCRRIEQWLSDPEEQSFALPAPANRAERDYQALLCAVCENRAALAAQSESDRRDLLDYYTLWLHQIKTPIAALHLLLSSPQQSPAEAEAELLKIEQYAAMALSYLRLDNAGADLVLVRGPIDPILRGAVRKYARLFILKKIALHFSDTGLSAVTDEAWLSFVLEQLLSNALKYTPAGGTITLRADGNALLVADNGIGIRAEDLPRVCEKGFTGYNGRTDKKATGLGLYLCSRVCQKLGHTLSITSRPGRGTTVRIGFDTAQRLYE